MVVEVGLKGEVREGQSVVASINVRNKKEKIKERKINMSPTSVFKNRC